MSLPVPTPGLIIRYGFLWSHERDGGAEEARKDRPCTIVIAAGRDARGEIRVILAPITHEPPVDAAAALEIPAAVCRRLGLDGRRQWLRFDELNRFVWPGFDLRPLPGRPGEYAYGTLPRDLFEALRKGIVERQRAGRGLIIVRD